MSSMVPPAADVPSISTKASGSAPSTRCTGAMAPVEVSLWAHAYTSAPGTAAGSTTEPASALTTLGGVRWGAAATAAANFPENSPNRACALCRVIKREQRHIPEQGGPAVAQHHLVSIGQAEQLAQSCANRADQILDRSLPMGGPQQSGPARREVAHRLGPDLGWSGAEPAVRGQQVGGNPEAGHAGRLCHA